MATTTGGIATLPLPFSMVRLGPGGSGRTQFFSLDQVRSMVLPDADDEELKRRKAIRGLLGATKGHP